MSVEAHPNSWSRGLVRTRTASPWMQELGIFSSVRSEIGQIIVAEVNRERVADLIVPDSAPMADLIGKPAAQPA